MYHMSRRVGGWASSRGQAKSAREDLIPSSAARAHLRQRGNTSSIGHCSRVARLAPWLVLLVWGAGVIFFEVFMVRYMVWTCTWPNYDDPKFEDVSGTRVLIVSDPRVVEGSTPKGFDSSFAGLLPEWIYEYSSDTYMGRAFSTLQYQNPEATFVTGQLFETNDSPEASRKVMQGRLDGIFRERSKSPLFYSGLAQGSDSEEWARDQVSRGEFNHRRSVGNFDFVSVNGPALQQPESEAGVETKAFLEDLAHTFNEMSRPRVLVSPVGFYKPAGSCHDDESTLKWGTLDEDLTQWIVQSVSPMILLGGSSSPTCQHLHKIEDLELQEISLGSFSWVGGDEYPSYVLLWASNPMDRRGLSGRAVLGSSVVLSSKTCFLPPQRLIHQVYLLLSIFAGVVWVVIPLLLAITDLSADWRSRSASQAPILSKPRPRKRVSSELEKGNGFSPGEGDCLIVYEKTYSHILRVFRNRFKESVICLIGLALILLSVAILDFFPIV